MIEYRLDVESYFNDGVMFTEEIHDNANVFFHGTSGEYHHAICSAGLLGLGTGLVTKIRVQRIVDFYSEIGWGGYAPYPNVTLSSFTKLDFKDSDIKKVYLSDEAHNSLKYALKSVAGGETVEAIRGCAEELVMLAKRPDDLDNLGIEAQLVNSFLKDNEDIFDFAISSRENYPFGCVYAILYGELEHPEKRPDSTYVDNEILPRQIIAYCKIPIEIDEERVMTFSPAFLKYFKNNL